MIRAFSASSARFIFKDAYKGQVKPPHSKALFGRDRNFLIYSLTFINLEL
jgi:hypothetical protein